MIQLTGNRQIRRVVAVQCCTTIVIALVLLYFGMLYAWSGFLGGIISSGMNGYAASKVFVRYRAQDPAKIMGDVYTAEITKLLVTGCLFVVVFAFVKPLSVGTLLGSYVFVQVVVPILVLLSEDQMKNRY